MAAIVLVFGAAGPPGQPPQPQIFGNAVYAGQIENSEIDEASGLAASRRRSDLLWTHNDSGAPPRLYAVGVDGRDHGAVDVRGASNVDWEDLAAFQIDEVPYLLIADVGDNDAERRSVMLYIVEEPELRRDRFEDGTAVSVAWSLEVVFEDGPVDCEGVAVDVPGQRVLLVSKRTRAGGAAAAVLYTALGKDQQALEGFFARLHRPACSGKIGDLYKRSAEIQTTSASSAI